MASPRPLICPSMLSCDFAQLRAESARMLDMGADYLHMDVMVQQCLRYM
jgi:ribulose-phosphate 3-epimerase